MSRSSFASVVVFSLLAACGGQTVAGDQLPGEVFVPQVDAGVDHGDRHPGAVGDAPRLLRTDPIEPPLPVARRIVDGRRRRRRGQRDENERE